MNGQQKIYKLDGCTVTRVQIRKPLARTCVLLACFACDPTEYVKERWSVRITNEVKWKMDVYIFGLFLFILLFLVLSSPGTSFHSGQLSSVSLVTCFFRKHSTAIQKPMQEVWMEFNNLKPGVIFAGINSVIIYHEYRKKISGLIGSWDKDKNQWI